MDTEQLRYILERDKYVKPHLLTVCPHDLVQQHIARATSGRRHTAAIVFNLDPSHLPGTHWVSMFLDFNGYAEYFDSTGLPPDPACREIMRSSCPRTPLLYNTLTLQDNTMVCGQFCVAFLKLRCRGYDFHKTIQYLNFPNNDRAVYDLVKSSFPKLPYHL